MFFISTFLLAFLFLSIFEYVFNFSAIQKVYALQMEIDPGFGYIENVDNIDKMDYDEQIKVYLYKYLLYYIKDVDVFETKEELVNYWMVLILSKDLKKNENMIKYITISNLKYTLGMKDKIGLLYRTAENLSNVFYKITHS